jgi:hypothetical protein
MEKEFNLEAFNSALNKHYMKVQQDILEYIDLVQELNGLEHTQKLITEKLNSMDESEYLEEMGVGSATKKSAAKAANQGSTARATLNAARNKVGAAANKVKSAVTAQAGKVKAGVKAMANTHKELVAKGKKLSSSKKKTCSSG